MGYGKKNEKLIPKRFNVVDSTLWFTDRMS